MQRKFSGQPQAQSTDTIQQHETTGVLENIYFAVFFHFGDWTDCTNQ